MRTTVRSRPGVGRRLAGLILRLLVAAALVTDAVVHIRQAPGYQLANPAGIGQGNLFYLESAAAILVALYVLVRGSRPAYFLALLVQRQRAGRSAALALRGPARAGAHPGNVRARLVFRKDAQRGC